MWQWGQDLLDEGEEELKKLALLVGDLELDGMEHVLQGLGIHDRGSLEQIRAVMHLCGTHPWVVRDIIWNCWQHGLRSVVEPPVRKVEAIFRQPVVAFGETLTQELEDHHTGLQAAFRVLDDLKGSGAVRLDETDRLFAQADDVWGQYTTLHATAHSILTSQPTSTARLIEQAGDALIAFACLTVMGTIIVTIIVVAVAATPETGGTSDLAVPAVIGGIAAEEVEQFLLAVLLALAILVECLQPLHRQWLTDFTVSIPTHLASTPATPTDWTLPDGSSLPESLRQMAENLWKQYKDRLQQMGLQDSEIVRLIAYLVATYCSATYIGKLLDSLANLPNYSVTREFRAKLQRFLAGTKNVTAEVKRLLYVGMHYIVQGYILKAVGLKHFDAAGQEIGDFDVIAEMPPPFTASATQPQYIAEVGGGANKGLINPKKPNEGYPAFQRQIQLLKEQARQANPPGSIVAQCFLEEPPYAKNPSDPNYVGPDDNDLWGRFERAEMYAQQELGAANVFIIPAGDKSGVCPVNPTPVASPSVPDEPISTPTTP